MSTKVTYPPSGGSGGGMSQEALNILTGNGTPADFAVVSSYLNGLSSDAYSTDPTYLIMQGQVGNIFDFGTYKSGSTLYNSTSVTENRKIYVRIIGFMHDTITAGGKAGFTFMHTHVVPCAYQMNASDTNSGGWNSSKMRTTNLSTSGEIWTSYPDTLIENGIIKAVNKMTNNTGNTTNVSAVTSTSDKLWIPSMREVYASTSAPYSAEGDQYEYFQSLGITESNYSPLSNLSIHTMNNGSSYASHQGSLSTGYWWLRSPNADYANNFRSVYSNGRYNYYDASYGRGLAPCFAI